MRIDNTSVLVGKTRHSYYAADGIDSLEMGKRLHIVFALVGDLQAFHHYVSISIIPTVVIPSCIHGIGHITYIAGKCSSRTDIA